MDKLPLEIIEKILSYLNPYEDYPHTIYVSKKFCQATRNIIKYRSRNFEVSFRNDRINFWKYRRFSEQLVPPSCAHHRGTICGQRMFIVSNQIFWSFDLVERKWTKLSFAPQELYAKALFKFENKIVVFLGPSWDHESDQDQDKSDSSVLLYDTEKNQVTCITEKAKPPCRFLTNPTVMGTQAVLVHYNPKKSSSGMSDIHCLDLESLTWTSETAICRDQPIELETLCQIKISENQLVYIGATWHGEEAWLLEMGVFFKWTRLSVFNEEHAPKKAEHLSKLVRMGRLAVCLAPAENASCQVGNRCCRHRDGRKKFSSLHMLDLSQAVDHRQLTWLRPSRACAIRGVLTGYTLLATPYEILVFGGLREDSKGRKTESNSLYTTYMATDDTSSAKSI